MPWAMYRAKSLGSGRTQIFDQEMHTRALARFMLETDLRRALERREFCLRYQPVVSLRTGRIGGFEALVRWNHPERGLLGPGAFLPLAEQTGLMRPLALYVLDHSLAQCARWQAEGLSLAVAVNLSAPNLLDVGLPATVAELLGKWDVEPSRLQLEITETIVGADPVRVGEVMTQLRALGVTLSLDDFGTGSSSLSYLRRLPVQELKIDKSFIFGMASDEQDAAIVRTTIELAHTLGLRVVAEGIETEDVSRTLTEYGCDHGQGFLLGRPMPAGDLTGIVHEQHRAAGRPRAAA